MSKGVRDLLNSLTQSERERAEYNAKLSPEEATMSDEEAECVDAVVANFVACEKKERTAAGLSRLAWSMAEMAAYYRRNGWTEVQVLEHFRTFYLGRLLITEDGRGIPTTEGPHSILAADGTFLAIATSSDINTAIEEIKKAGLWPWEVVVIM